MVDRQPKTGLGDGWGKGEKWWFAHVCSSYLLTNHDRLLVGEDWRGLICLDMFRLQGQQQMQNLCASSEEDHASHSTDRHRWHDRSVALGLQRAAHLQFQRVVQRASLTPDMVYTLNIRMEDRGNAQ